MDALPYDGRAILLYKLPNYKVREGLSMFTLYPKESVPHNGKLFVIEGPDGSGKETQTRLLLNRLQEEGYEKVIHVAFPNYDSFSSTLLKKYLEGYYANQYSDTSNMIFVKQMSMMYAVDRVSTFIEEVHDGKSLITLLSEGYTILCDRYTTSNIMHQSANLINPLHVSDFIRWIEEQEYFHLGLPEPDDVIFLDVPPEGSIANLKKRYNDEPREDILENIEHQTRLHSVKDRVIRMCGWSKIDCYQNGTMLPIETIHEDIYSHIKKSI